MQTLRFPRKPSPFGALRAALIALALTAPTLLGACSAGGAFVGGAAGGALAASEERGLKGAIKDGAIRAEINYRWLDYDAKAQHALGLSVYEGRVLLTGVAKSDEVRAELVRLAWQPDGVREVINEIIVDPKGESGTYARDVWISTQLRSKILFDKQVYGINYSIDVVRHVVYLLGVAQDRAELDRVLNHARNVEYVERVVNHVILKDDPRRKG